MNREMKDTLCGVVWYGLFLVVMAIVIFGFYKYTI